jgi:hypothetical protein
MKEKFMKHYLGLGPRRFVIGTVILLIIMDIVSGYYLKLSWESKNVYEQMVHFWIKSLKLQTGDLSADTLVEVSGLMQKSLNFFLFLLFLNNLFFYFFYLRKKLWAQGYILFYTLTGALFSLMMIFDGMGAGWIAVNIICAIIYTYLFFGVKFLKSETTLVPEKKGL